MKQNEFRSVHDYLDKRFKGQSPTKQEVKQAKKDYWRMYNTALKRRIRKQYPIVRLRFSKQEMNRIKEKLDNKELLSIQVRRIVLDYINGTTTTGNMALIEQQLFLISEYVQELLEVGDAVSLGKIEKLQQSIIAIQDALEQS